MKALLSFTIAIVATSKLGALSKVFHHKLTCFSGIIPITERGNAVYELIVKLLFYTKTHYRASIYHVASRTPAIQFNPQ
jgi:hypothetical protein